MLRINSAVCRSVALMSHAGQQLEHMGPVVILKNRFLTFLLPVRYFPNVQKEKYRPMTSV